MSLPRSRVLETLQPSQAHLFQFKINANSECRLLPEARQDFCVPLYLCIGLYNCTDQTVASCTDRLYTSDYRSLRVVTPSAAASRNGAALAWPIGDNWV